jgi:hypothetical protein
MMVVFEVHLAPGMDTSQLLSAEAVRDTQAQIMTLDDARKVGFAGLPEPPPGQEVRLIAVAKRDAGYVQRRLEANDAAMSFRMHEVG